MYDYIKQPAEIYRRSFELVRQEVDLSGVPQVLTDVVIRLIHACGMPDITGDLAWHADPATAAAHALRRGAPILVDCQMVCAGIIVSRLNGNRVVCTLNHADVAQLSATRASTRSAAAVELWSSHLHGAVVAIGNAPTALFRLLELLTDGAPKPAAIFAFPVGFVGAAESKQALINAQLDVPYLTLKGRRGGSAMASAAVNAVAGLS